jgi:acyl-CoA oxidase
MGGHGYSRFNMIGALRNNNDINTTWEGDNTVLQQQTAKFILDNFQKRMKGKDPSKEYSTLKFMNRLDDDSKPEFKSSKDLEKVENLRTCFQQRIIVLLLKSVEKLANQVQEKKDSLLVAWNNSQVFYIQPMVKAFIENYVFECFLDIIEKIQEDSTRKMMMSFLRLYSFTVFDSEWSLLRNDDFIDSDAVFLIKEEILNLCKMLKSELIPILDIIAPDDEILQAPMGRSDGRIWESYFSKVFSFNRCFERLDWWENLHFK